MLPPGTQLGRYTVSHRLGAGGMGDVYLAVDSILGRQVAVKVLPEDLATNPDRLARFAREARAVSALNHPNVLTVHDFGQDGATHYLVTEFVDGRTLRAWVGEERPALVDVLGVLAQAASALAAAHEAGVVHRDVKPENLMLRRDGLVKVLDFGIAKLASGALADTGASTAPEGQTAPGMILGTVRYMSPEQAIGEPLDASTDIWSLGVVLYELVAGRSPFVRATPMATLAAILEREPVPLASAAPGTPDAVCRVAAKALRKRKEERFATAADMAAALELARQDVEVEPQRTFMQDDIATRALAVTVAEPGAGSGWHPPATSAAPLPPTNLPPRTSTLVGRTRELDELTSMLRDGETRMVTLTGAGGTGKTRLAVEVGRLLLGEFADGVFAVDLSTLKDPALIASHAAAVFGLKESAGSTLAAGLEGFLAEKEMLLVLDNFEHLLAGAPSVSRLLAAAPGLTVLATSRALLRLSAEREYAVEPLEVPVFASLPPLDELARSAAVALFVERAREARPSFALTAENARTVVEICRRLDGLPLALELAAARVRLLSPQAMLERLAHRLKLLTGGARDLPSRQQTMRGAVAWSYELLDDAEKAVLRRLAVFAGGWMLEAAEAVCGAGGVDVLDALGSLVDKSLIRQRELVDGEMRFMMLEVVREYALEQLEASGEADETRLAHGRYFLRLAEAARSAMWGADQAVWVERFRREYDNLVDAVSVLMDREPAKGTALVLDLSTFCQILCLHSQRRTWHMRALEAGPSPEVRARLLHGLSNCELRLGNFGVAAEFSRQAVEAIRELGEGRALALALNGLGQALLKCDDAGGARQAHEEGLAIAREIGDPMVVSLFFNSLGEVERSAGDLRAARAAYEQALEEAGRHARFNNNAIALLNLGGVTLEQGDLAAASGYYGESLSIAAELGDSSLSADAVDGLAAVALQAGYREKAARLAGAAEALYESTEGPREPREQSLRDRYVAALRASLDAAVLEREWTRGRALTLDEAVDTALGE